DPADRQPTLVIPINLLREDKTYTDWEFSNAEELEKLWEPVLAELKAYALPFVARYSRLADLRKTLESSDKQDWLSAGLNVDSRVTVLAAIQLVEGNKSGARKTLDDGIESLAETLAARPQELRKRRADMEFLRNRLLANG